MKIKKFAGIVAVSTLLLGSVATGTACGGKPHTVERVSETQATCTEGGHAAYYKCTDDGCDKLFSDIDGKYEITWDDVEKTNPLGHKMKKNDAKAPNCTEDGSKEHYHCERCKNNYADQNGETPLTDAVIPALNHDMKIVNKQIPQTGKPGIKAHYLCERENKKYFDSFGDKAVTDENKHELEYNMLMPAPSGWYDVNHDFSHSNDANPYVTITGGDGLNVATSEFYTEIAYTARVRKAAVYRQFIVFFFENKGIYSISVDDGKINCDSGMSGWGYGTDQGYTYLNDEWAGYTLTAGELDSYEGDGLEVTLARTGNKVQVLVNGREVHSVTLADEYKSEPSKGGMLVWDAVPGTNYYFRVDGQAAKPEAPQVNLDFDTTQGGVTLNKETFAYGDELVITVAPAENYVFDKLIVNGREITALTNGKYTTTATTVVNISVVFKAKEYGSVNAAVSGNKHGISGNSIAADADFELVGKNETYSGKLSNGTLKVSKIFTGEYTLKIANHLSGTITVEKDTAYEAQIVLEYDLLAVNKTNNIGADQVDLSHQNDAQSYINVTGGGGHLNVTANERYGDVMVTATFKRENVWNQRMGFLLAFSDKEGVQLGFDTFDDANNVTLHFWYEGEHHPGYASVRDYYNFKPDSFARLNGAFDLTGCAPLKAEWLKKFNEDGLEVSLVRKGNVILAVVEGEIVGAVEVDSKYKADTVQLGFFAEWVNPMQIPFEITTSLPDFTAPTFKLTQGQNGTVTKTSGDTYSVWEKITLEIEPQTDYRLKQLTVNGVVITGNKTEYSFFPIEGENTVVAEFEEIAYGSVNAALKGNKHGVAGNAIVDGTAVKLVGAKEYSATVTGSKIQVEKIEAGTYSVEVAGYLKGTIIIGEGSEYETEIVLEYDMFTSNGWYDVHQKFEHQNDANAYVSVTGGDGTDGVNFVTKNGYDQVAITVTVGKDFYKHGRAGVLMKFGNSMVWFTVKQENGSPVGFEWYGMPHWDSDTVFPDKWGGFDGASFTAADTASWEAGNMKLTLVRDGNKFYAFVNGELRDTAIADESYATQKTQAGVRVEGSKTEGDRWYVSVEEDISEYLDKVQSTND